jgi:hypothetical protein
MTDTDKHSAIEAAACKNCDKRGMNYWGEVWFHPTVATAGIGLCTTYPKDSSLLKITPDDYVCSDYVPAARAQGESS